jgi:hypothetical protein
VTAFCTAKLALSSWLYGTLAKAWPPLCASSGACALNKYGYACASLKGAGPCIKIEEHVKIVLLLQHQKNAL